MRVLITAICMFGLMGACASMQEAWVNETCNFSGAYAVGINDQQEGTPMTPSQFYSCPSRTRAKVGRGYRKGYYDSLKTQKVSHSGESTVDVFMDGPTLRLSQNRKQKRSYYCRTEAFTDEYEAFGRTLMQARRRVLTQCTYKHNKMFCKNMSCQIHR